MTVPHRRSLQPLADALAAAAVIVRRGAFLVIETMLFRVLFYPTGRREQSPDRFGHSESTKCECAEANGFVNRVLICSGRRKRVTTEELRMTAAASRTMLWAPSWSRQWESLNDCIAECNG